MIEGHAVITTSVIFTRGRRVYSVLWDHNAGRLGEYPSEFESQAKELFDSLGPAGVWEVGKYKLDLWNWTEGRKFATPNGIGVCVRSVDELSGEWLVELAGGTFSWKPVDGINIVSSVVGANILAELFVGFPSTPSASASSAEDRAHHP